MDMHKKIQKIMAKPMNLMDDFSEYLLDGIKPTLDVEVAAELLEVDEKSQETKLLAQKILERKLAFINDFKRIMEEHNVKML